MRHASPERAHTSEKETARIEAFSDGVFAFAITLLALELKVPHFDEAHGEPDATALCLALLKQWPSYVAFAMSFVTILIMWTHHHALFRLVRRADRSLLFANGLLLLLVTTVAFPTGVVAEYIMTPAAPTAAVFYVGQQVLLSTAFYVLLLTAIRPAVLSPEAPTEKVKRLRRSYLIGPPLYLLTMLLAAYAPQLAMGLSLVLWIFWAAVPSVLDERRSA